MQQLASAQDKHDKDPIHVGTLQCLQARAEYLCKELALKRERNQWLTSHNAKECIEMVKVQIKNHHHVVFTTQDSSPYLFKPVWTSVNQNQERVPHPSLMPFSSTEQKSEVVDATFIEHLWSLHVAGAYRRELKAMEDVSTTRSKVIWVSKDMKVKKGDREPLVVSNNNYWKA
ncbi:hypothetical protein DXG01_015221 [Tephrocybe rancida]|nr:hypothetical protein DXG01_015221 [Tephrocybe rancida]